MIAYRDRPTELFGLLQSLRTQTYQDWDVFIRDDCSGTNMYAYHFLNCIFMRLRCENHNIFIKRNEFNYGVSRNRQALVEDVFEKGVKYTLLARLDDDVICEPDYIERLIKVLYSDGYDIASGITTPMTCPTFKRDPKFLKGIVNRVVLDQDGNYLINGDDCGYSYTESMILPAHHFRSCALIKRQVHDEVKYWPTRFNKHGFREEQIFSYKALMAGFKIGVDTGAVNYHQLTPSGGERFSDSSELIRFNQLILEEFTRENKIELAKIFL